MEAKEIGVEETSKLFGDTDKRKEDKNVKTETGPDTHKDHNTSQSKGKKDRDYIRSPKDTKSPRSPKSPGQSKSCKRKRGLGGQGGQPYTLHSPKQDKISKFFTKKSPKEATAKSRGEMSSKDKGRRGEEHKPSTIIVQGARSPLLGDKGGSQSHSSDDTGAEKPSIAPVGVPEESGRGSRKEADKKRTKLVLEKWAKAPNIKTGGSAKKPKLRKRQTEDSPKACRFKDIRTMFEKMDSAQCKESKDKDIRKPDIEDENKKEKQENICEVE